MATRDNPAQRTLETIRSALRDDGRDHITFLVVCCGSNANVAAISLLRRVEELRDDGFEVDLGRYSDTALVKNGDDCRRLYICNEEDLEKLVAMAEKRTEEEEI